MRIIIQPLGAQRLGDLLKKCLRDTKFTHFRAAVAFVRSSGVKHLARELQAFTGRKCKVSITVGIDSKGTSEEGLRQLRQAVGRKGKIVVFHNENVSTFHPKIYIFSGPDKAILILGSSNLTEGGLFTNYEASLLIELNLTENQDRRLLRRLNKILDDWEDTSTGLAKQLTGTLITKLVKKGYLSVDAQEAIEGIPEEETVSDFFRRRKAHPTSDEVFSRVAVPRAPRAPSPAVSVKQHKRRVSRKGFVMTLQQTDAGIGQRTAGALKRSPEIFIPLAARNAAPAFWGWPQQFAQDSSRPGKLDRKGVVFRLGNRSIKVTIWYYPPRHEFRLRSEELRAPANVGDILRLEKVSRQSYDYYADIIPQGTSDYAYYLSLCTNPVRNSHKRWGYY